MQSVSPEEKERKLGEILAQLERDKPDENWTLLESFARVVYSGLQVWMARGIGSSDLADRIWDNYRPRHSSTGGSQGFMWWPGTPPRESRFIRSGARPFRWTPPSSKFTPPTRLSSSTV